MLVNAIIGHTIGDTIGVPFEMMPRNRLKKFPIKEIYDENKYSDDTVMTLATMKAIIDNGGKINYEDIMYEFYLWLSEGKYTPDGMPYGFGNTTFRAVNNFSLGFDALDCGIDEEYANGNGALMRMLPIIFYLHSINAEEKKILSVVNNATRLTHAHEINKIGTYIFVRYCLFLLDGHDKFDSYNMIKELNYKIFHKKALRKYKRILKEDISKYREKDIKSGIAIYETLEAVLWSILTTNGFKDTLLKAVNLGGDTDTVGAITGGVCGILYPNEIPKEWENKIKNIKFIKKLSKDFEESLKGNSK